MHWDDIYRDRDAAELSWFEAAPERSLDLIMRHARPRDAVLDVGGGASRLPDALLDAGFCDVSVLDLSAEALAVSRARLGMRARDVNWQVADVTRWRPRRRYRVWHDRAVFHFLTDPAQRAAYVLNLQEALAPHGLAIIATFALNGPEQCSGLPVLRYSPETLTDELARHAPGRFDLLEHCAYAHRTPMGREQRFQYSVFRRA